MILPLPGHGTLIQYKKLGIYLIGDSGIGKSEVALELIHQGAVLICDDAPEFYSTTDKKLFGACPEGFYGLMHIRDLGLLNIIDLLGHHAFKNSHHVDFVVELIQTQDNVLSPTQLKPEYLSWYHQHWTIPGIRLHLYSGRNTSVLIKTAIMQFNNYKNEFREKSQ